MLVPHVGRVPCYVQECNGQRWALGLLTGYYIGYLTTAALGNAVGMNLSKEQLCLTCQGVLYYRIDILLFIITA